MARILLKNSPIKSCTCNARLGTPNFNFSPPNQKELPTALAPISDVLNKRQIYSPLGLTSAATLYVRRSLALIISSRDCREADSRDTSPRHACLGEASRKIWLHDFAINNNGGSVPVIFISLLSTI